VLHVLSLDLHTSTRQTEAHIKTLLALKSTDLDPVASAKAAWDALLNFASEAGPAARSLKRADLPAALVQAYGEVGATEQRVLTALKSHTDFVLRRSAPRSDRPSTCGAPASSKRCLRLSRRSKSS
jgi:hypothetical protein